MESGGSASHLPLPPSSPPPSSGVKRPHAQMAHAAYHPPSPIFTSVFTGDDSPPRLSPSSPRRQRLVLPPLVPTIRSPPGGSNMPPPQRRRGFDYRRPVTTTTNSQSTPSSADIVDLTADDDVQADEGQEDQDYGSHTRVHEFNRPSHQQRSRQQERQRLPRFGRAIIDLSQDTGAVQTQQNDAELSQGRSPENRRRTPYREDRITPTLRRESSSDVTFMHQRRRAGSIHRQGYTESDPPTPSPPRHRATQTQNVFFDLTGTSDPAEEEDVIFVSSRTNPNPHPSTHPTVNVVSPRRPPGRHVHRDSDDDVSAAPASPSSMAAVWARVQQYSGLEGHTSDSMWRALGARLYNSAAEQMNRAEALRRGPPRPPGTQTSGWQAPGPLNYSGAAFDLQLDGYPGRRQEQQYEPPPDAPEGFTRSPATVQDEVVCPACGDELATGMTEEKRQVWVVKACGHVYCGTCIANRAKTKQRGAKGKGRAIAAIKESDPMAPPPVQSPQFSECMVDGCKSTMKNKTSILQVFL